MKPSEISLAKERLSKLKDLDKLLEVFEEGDGEISPCLAPGMLLEIDMDAAPDSPAAIVQLVGEGRSCALERPEIRVALLVLVQQALEDDRATLLAALRKMGVEVE